MDRFRARAGGFYALTLRTLKYFWRPKCFFQYEICINVSVMLFPLHFNTYVMGLRSLGIFDAYSAGTDSRRQKLTSTDVRFQRLKSVLALYGLNTKTRAPTRTADIFRFV